MPISANHANERKPCDSAVETKVGGAISYGAEGRVRLQSQSLPVDL